MQNPLLWLALSLLLVAVSLTAMLAIAIPAIQELARAARSAERLLDMLRQELPPVLRSMQNTGQELSQLSDQVNEGVRSASQVVKQVDQGIDNMRHQAKTTRRMGRSFATGLRAAWVQLSQSSASSRPVPSPSNHRPVAPQESSEMSQGYWVYEEENQKLTEEVTEVNLTEDSSGHRGTTT